MRLTPGTRVGPYEVVLLLGRGMSEVYRATDTRLGRDVALKVVGEPLGTHGPAVERFEREARLAASLSHPNVVALYDVGLHEGQPYFITELLQGQTLRERLQQGPIPPAEAVDWALQTVQGLAAVHARGIVHRDLKPENLFITSTDQVKLLDFGIAKIVEAALQESVPRGLMEETRSPSGHDTTTGMVIGTPGYMSPEQVRGEPVDVRSDIFSVGAVIHEMLSGGRAFSGTSLVEAGYAILHGEPGPLPEGIPAPLAAVVRRCLDKDPARRFQSVHALASALSAARQPSGSDDGTAPTARSRTMVPLSRRLLPVWIFTAAALGVATLLLVRAWKADAFWRNPLAGARFQPLTDSEEAEHSGAISRDGQVVAFLSARDGPTDVWFTRVGSGVPLNATRGRLPEIVFNRGLRMLNFSPDGAFVGLWLGPSDRLKRKQIDTWSVPTLPAEPRRFLVGDVEPDWSADGRQLVYHHPTTGDPTFVQPENGEPRQIHVAPSGEKTAQHAHFQTWSPDGAFIYFVQGDIPNPRGPQDIWRVRAYGGPAERVTFHDTWVTHPTFVDHSTLLYLATTSDGRGPFIHGLDVDRGVPHRLGDGATAYTSLAASTDGRRLVATTAQQRSSLWSVPLGGSPATEAEATRIKLPTSQGRWPRLGTDFLVYVSSSGATDRLWKTTGEASTELWASSGPRITAAPALSPSADQIAFCTEDGGRRRLLVVGSDGSGLRTVTDTLALRGGPDWAPDGKSLIVAAEVGGIPRLFRVDARTGRPDQVLDDYALGPVWAPDGALIVYSGPDIGTSFPVKAVTPSGQPRSIPEFVLNRGARRFRFLPGEPTLVIARGDMESRNLWVRDLATGAERQLTRFDRQVVMNDFDLSPDGRVLVFERVQDSSDIVLIERAER